MNISEFAREVHQNAVDHGWWDTDRDAAEVIALIHSEWSEALEEYRAGRPMVWYECEEAGKSEICAPKDPYDCLHYSDNEHCKYRGKKPEGIAAELIDGCIRILDYIAHEGRNTMERAEMEQIMELMTQYGGQVEETVEEMMGL